ncbi:MAG: bacillithiol biosynthesis deacetylase BshB1 [Phycisphaeraceae bacterium]|nr:bacillithiol biosynthesis deacetylase BshB1 [Phycisphaerales bacterium]MCB9859622.1 bacillithiol biosynthesis deacetylase BshB1 [Phycisphaeraceae bacterium]
MANILVVGPHPDDQELGMGGTVALLASQGHRVTLLDITNGEPTPFGNPETRATEASAAAQALSHPGNPVERIQLGLRNRFVEHTIENRHKVAGIMRRVQASIVLVPYFEDAHPDHRAVTRIVEDARFDAKLTGLSMPGDNDQPPIYPKWLFHYYATHLRIVREPSLIVDITQTMDAKMKSIEAYASQFIVNEKNRAVMEWVRAFNRFMGSRIGVEYGEPFHAAEPIGLNGLGNLV